MPSSKEWRLDKLKGGTRWKRAPTAEGEHALEVRANCGGLEARANRDRVKYALFEGKGGDEFPFFLAHDRSFNARGFGD